jgi:hypothetical protein
MSIVRFAWWKRSFAQPRLTLILGSALAGTLAVVGCGDSDNPLRSVSAGGGGASGSSTVGGDSGTSGSATSGSAAGGSAAGGSSGKGGGGAASGGGGSAGATGGSTAGGGNGGTAGGGVLCPSDAGAAGAGEDVADPTGDTDGDGTANCLDGCPADSSKIEPGECGCGASDFDSDGDGTFDCDDACPADATKTAPGVCGCGASDTANADNDAAVDCNDACPRDPALTEAGDCGCLPASLGALCLAHRYQFDGTGTVVTDSIAGATGDGAVVGATLADTGTLVLGGGASDQYVQLPARLISSMGNSATIEAWVTWAGTGGSWQRIFDFGSSDAPAGMQGEGRGYLFLTPRSGGGVFRTAISSFNFTEEDVVSAADALPTALAHVAVVVDGAAKTLTLYQDGVSQGTPATIRPNITLALLNDANNWLGRSQYQPDEELAGTFHEVRIYSRALTSAQLTANFTAGPDALP